tara:strand:- start:424 stop:648 length:225 start_codon:yes stop_codon:yes gene_type:complete
MEDTKLYNKFMNYSSQEETTIFEIYIKNEETLQTGWDIKYVRSTEDKIKTFPLFDVIITRNDLPCKDCNIINWF